MVCIIDSGDISGLLVRRSFSGKPDTYSVAWRQDEWPVVKSQLALLVAEGGRIDWIGRARGRKKVSDRDRRIEVTDIEEFPGPSIDDLRSWLPEKHDGDVLLGVLSNDLATVVLRELLERFPDWANKIEWLNRPKEFDLPAGNRGRILNEERDGVGLILEMSGVGKDTLRGWSPTLPHQPTFLSGIGQRSVSEEQLINHDIGRFPGLVGRGSLDIDWRVFSKGRRRVFVMNANMQPVEQTLGVDVVYYNETFRSFVLVQYKRMVREGEGAASRRPWYRPDSNLSSELERMRVVDERCVAAEGEFRLFGKACWVKLCESDSRAGGPDELIRGMYLAREYFVELLEVCKGPKGGTRIGYDNVPRHINNTTFIELVKDGWIGTRGTGSDELEEVVASVLESRRALVLGAPL